MKLSFPILMILVFVLANGFRPVTGPAWYAGGAGIPIAILVVVALLGLLTTR